MLYINILVLDLKFYNFLLSRFIYIIIGFLKLASLLNYLKTLLYYLRKRFLIN